MAASPKVYYPTTAYDHSFGEEPYEFVTAESEAAADALVTARSSTRPRPIPIGGSPAALLAPPASVPANWVTMFFADALEQETVDSSPVRDEEMPDRSDNEGEAEGAVSFGDDFAAVDVPFRSSPPRDDAVREYIKMEPVANDSEGEARGNVSFSDGEASESLEESDSSDDVIIVSMIEHKAAADVPHNDMLDAEEEEEAVLRRARAARDAKRDAKPAGDTDVRERAEARLFHRPLAAIAEHLQLYGSSASTVAPHRLVYSMDERDMKILIDIGTGLDDAISASGYTHAPKGQVNQFTARRDAHIGRARYLLLVQHVEFAPGLQGQGLFALFLDMLTRALLEHPKKIAAVVFFYVHQDLLQHVRFDPRFTFLTFGDSAIRDVRLKKRSAHELAKAHSVPKHINPDAPKESKKVHMLLMGPLAKLGGFCEAALTTGKKKAANLPLAASVAGLGEALAKALVPSKSNVLIVIERDLQGDIDRSGASVIDQGVVLGSVRVHLEWLDRATLHLPANTDAAAEDAETRFANAFFRPAWSSAISSHPLDKTAPVLLTPGPGLWTNDTHVLVLRELRVTFWGDADAWFEAGHVIKEAALRFLVDHCALTKCALLLADADLLASMGENAEKVIDFAMGFGDCTGEQLRLRFAPVSFVAHGQQQQGLFFGPQLRHKEVPAAYEVPVAPVPPPRKKAVAPSRKRKRSHHASSDVAQPRGKKQRRAE